MSDEIHIWVVGLDWSGKELDSGYLLLSECERNRSDRFLIDRVRREYIASHSALRCILSDYTGVAAELLTFGAHAHGKPYLLRPELRLEFNLSHTRGCALIAVATGVAVGVDIERHKLGIEIEALAARFFAKLEYEQLMSLSSGEERYAAFYRIWTRKEAFIKANGQGLSFGLKNFEVSLREEGDDCLLSVNDSAKLARHWALGSVFIEEEACTAAFAVQGLAKNVQIKRWSPRILDE